MAILLFDRCEAVAQDAVHDYPGNLTWTAVGTPEVSTSGVHIGTNGFFFNASGDEYEIPATGVISTAQGCMGCWFRVSAWVNNTIFLRAKGTSVNDLLQLELGTTDELIFRHRVNGVLNTTITTTAANLATGTFYFAVCRWHPGNDDRRLEVYDTSLNLIEAVEDTATAIQAQTDLITIEALTSSTPDVSVDNIMISDTYGEQLHNYANFDSYTDFSAGGTIVPLLHHQMMRKRRLCI